MLGYVLSMAAHRQLQQTALPSRSRMSCNMPSRLPLRSVFCVHSCWCTCDMQWLAEAAGHQRIGSIGCRQGSEVGDPVCSSVALLISHMQGKALQTDLAVASFMLAVAADCVAGQVLVPGRCRDRYRYEPWCCHCRGPRPMSIGRPIPDANMHFPALPLLPQPCAT
jgi:hypothetical protein